MGPFDYDPSAPKCNQCVFLSYYKCRYRSRSTPGDDTKADQADFPDSCNDGNQGADSDLDVGTTQELRSTPDALWDGTNTGPDHFIDDRDDVKQEADWDVESVTTQEFSTLDPLDILLDYILKNSDADCAIACHDDIQELFPGRDGWPEDLGEYLNANPPTIDVNETKTGTLSIEQAIRQHHLWEEGNLTETRADQKAAIDKKRAAFLDLQAVGNNAIHPGNDVAPGQAGGLLAATIVSAKDAPGRTRILDWPRHVLYNGGVVSSLTVSKDGTHIAAGFDDSFVRVWDLQTSVVFQLQGHSDNVWVTMFSPSENNKLVSGSADKTAIIWDVNTCDIARTLSAPDITGSVYTVAYAPDGKTIATGSDNGFVYLWDADTGERKHHLKVHASVGLVLAFSPMGNRLVCVVTKGWIWDPVSGQQLGMIDGHVDGIVSCMAFSPDGSRILTGADDQTARVWSSENGEELVTLREHTAAVWAVAWSPDSQHVATGGLDETIVVCNSYSGEIIHLLRDRPSPVTTLLWTEDLLIAGAADGTVRLWNDKTGAFVAELQGHTDRVNTTVLAKGGVNVVSSAEDGTIRKWDMRDILRF
ncbi:hypothetical protein EUX98_g8641 [Antrodiella citrinella]|uniref:Uncharacterized protein n=1 Tax=Antrodiella citrinella TaxID=2447956 RepID=A0A4S4M4P6_9APHY|nr:hypothetical protein EUX98_g8641 [Antrodiella citrinella]